MNVNQKGVKGLIKVIDDLQDKGFYTFPAFDDHSPVDLVAMSREGQTYRLQVKFLSTMKCKKSERYWLRSVTIVNRKAIPINRDMIDGWAVYLSESSKVVYIRKELMEGQKHLTLDPNQDYGELAEWSKAVLC